MLAYPKPTKRKQNRLGYHPNPNRTPFQGRKKMPRTPQIIGVRFQPSDPLRYFDANGLRLAAGDRVVVETDGGEREGVVAIAPGQALRSDLRGPLNRALRRAADGGDADVRGGAD